MKKTVEYTSPYTFKGAIPLRQAIPLGLQHVLAMFVGNLTPLMIICGICGITSEEPALYVTLLQNAMLAAEELSEKYPERKVLVVDALCASMGQGLLVYLAAQQKAPKKKLSLPEKAAKEESACLAAIRETICDGGALSAMERAMDDMAADISRTAACAVVRSLGREGRVCA